LKLKAAGRIKSLEVVVSIDPLNGNFPEKEVKMAGSMTKKEMIKNWGQEAGLRVMEFEEGGSHFYPEVKWKGGSWLGMRVIVEELGKKFPVAHIPPSPEMMVSICYTSGTTGMPKVRLPGKIKSKSLWWQRRRSQGAIITHKNMAAAAFASVYQNCAVLPAERREVAMSFLPVSELLFLIF
jgi:hypothetical protein